MNGICSPTTAVELTHQIQVEKGNFQQAIRDGKEFSHVQEILQRIRKLEEQLNFSHELKSDRVIAQVSE